jgi:hypothetical protein
MQVLIDSDVTLDFLLMRLPFAHEAREVFKACAQGRLTGCCAAITPIAAFATAQAAIGAANTRALVGDLLTIVSVCPLDAATLHAAHALPLTDFADALQVASGRGKAERGGAVGALRIGGSLIISTQPAAKQLADRVEQHPLNAFVTVRPPCCSMWSLLAPQHFLGTADL